MASVIQNNFRVRKNYAKITKIIDIPNLIDIQKQSYEKFLQKDIPQDQREDVGLQGVFKSVFPIKDFSETSSLEFVSYNLDKPKYDVDECRQRGMTFAAPIKVVIRLVVWDTNEETGHQSIRDVKEQEVYFGEIPLMTEVGTFIINGIERVVVSQLHRSPGVIFEHDRGKTHSSGKLLYSARVIPYRGSWLDFEFDPKDCVFARIDRRRKLPVTIILRALGYTEEQILDMFFEKNVFHLSKKEITFEIIPQRLRGETASFEIRVGKKVIVEEGRRITARHVRELEEAQVKRLPVPTEYLQGKVLAHDIVNTETGELLAKANEVLTVTSVGKL